MEAFQGEGVVIVEVPPVAYAAYERLGMLAVGIIDHCKEAGVEVPDEIREFYPLLVDALNSAHAAYIDLVWGMLYQAARDAGLPVEVQRPAQ
jgi:hypothetical protein